MELLHLFKLCCCCWSKKKKILCSWHLCYRLQFSVRKLSLIESVKESSVSSGKHSPQVILVRWLHNTRLHFISNGTPFSCRLARWCEKSKYSKSSVSFVTWQAVAGRIPAMASAQQTFCCQQGASGPGQGGDGQVTSFFPPARHAHCRRDDRQRGMMSETGL